MELLKQNKIKLFIGTLLVIVGIFIGLWLQPKLDRPAKGVTSTEEERAVTARMETVENMEACKNLAKWQIAKEKQIDLDNKSKDEAKKAIEAYNAFYSQYEASDKAYSEKTDKILSEQQKNAIRDIKL